MATEVICPDCGKVIAPRGSIDETTRCRCAEAPTGPRVTVDDVSLRPSLSVPITPVASQGTVDDDIETFGENSDATAKEKTCYVCGKSLAGRVRLKDHLGRYWCKQCAAADKRAKRHEEKGRCPDCSRVFKPDKLVYFQNVKVCPTCYKAREKALEKKILKAGIEHVQEKHEINKIKWLAITAGVILLLAIVHHFMR